MLLPTQLLLALAAFTTCAINTPHQQYFIERTLQLAIPLKHNASLSIRRAALMACYAAMESFVSNQSQSQSQSQTSIANFADSPLAMLSNLHNTRRTEVPNRSMNVVADLADWCVATLGVEADKQSRDIMILMIRPSDFVCKIIVDATRTGGMAIFMNHYCEPNAYAKIIQCDDAGLDKHIVIMAARDIQEGEEVTYDYKFPLEDKKLRCYCGASRCKGSMN